MLLCESFLKPISCFTLFIAVYIGETGIAYSCTCTNKASGAFYDCNLPVSVYTHKKRYLISDILKMNWWEALGHCRVINMHLGVIFNRNEEKTLKSSILSDENYWLSGYSIANVSKGFVWLSSGLEVRRNFWSSGQPAEGGCVVVSDAGLATRSCEEELPFVCEQYDS